MTIGPSRPRRTRPRFVIGGQKTAGRPRFVKGSASGLSLDEASLKRAHAAAGLKGYVTNITASRMGALEVVTSYRQLWHVEASWRMSKHDLPAHTVFGHQRDAIEAHLTVVTTALAVAHYLQETTGLSIKKIIHTLKPLQNVEVTITGHTFLAQPQLTTQATQIIKSVSPPRPKVTRARPKVPSEALNSVSIIAINSLLLMSLRD